MTSYAKEKGAKMLTRIPRLMPTWVYCRNIPEPNVEDFSYFDFDYLANKLQILSYYEIEYRY